MKLLCFYLEKFHHYFLFCILNSMCVWESESIYIPEPRYMSKIPENINDKHDSAHCFENYLECTIIIHPHYKSLTKNYFINFYIENTSPDAKCFFANISLSKGCSLVKIFQGTHTIIWGSEVLKCQEKYLHKENLKYFVLSE